MDSALKRQEREDRIRARKKAILFYDGLVKIIANYSCPFKAGNVAFLEGEQCEARQAWMKLYGAACRVRNIAQSYQLQDVAEGEFEK